MPAEEATAHETPPRDLAEDLATYQAGLDAVRLGQCSGVSLGRMARGGSVALEGFAHAARRALAAEALLAKLQALGAILAQRSLYTERHPLTFGYTNHRGDRRPRRVLPLLLYHGSTDYHPVAQWLLDAHDVELPYGSQRLRSFAVADIDLEDIG